VNAVSTTLEVGRVTEAAWLAERMTGIGASEAAQALGVSEYGTPLELFLRKIGELPPPAENDAMTWGKRLEPLIAQAWMNETGKIVDRQQVFTRSTLHPHLFATLDAIGSKGELVEFKTLGAFRSRELGEDGSDQIPDEWVIQAHQQMLCARELPDVDCERVHFAVLVGGQRLRLFEVRWSDRLIEGMLPGLEDFWRRVQSRTPPPPSAGSDARLYSVLHPHAAGEVRLDDRLAACASRWAELSDEIKAREAERELLKAELLAAVGDAGTAHLPDGRALRRIVRNVKGGTYTRPDYTSTELRWAKGLGF
jgi:putative phage-type endonuclease